MLESQNQRLQPREKCQQLGADALSDAELLAILLRTGYKGCPVFELSQNILNHFGGDLLALCNASVGELSKIPGLGRIKSIELCTVFSLVKRLARLRAIERPDMSSPISIVAYMHSFFLSSQQEEFYVLLLDTKLRLIKCERVSVGLVDRSLVHPREVFRSAIKESSSAIILCHNHPSGEVRPSQPDKMITQTLNAAGDIIGIKVVDHIIVGSNENGGDVSYYSFLENGLMTNEKKK